MRSEIDYDFPARNRKPSWLKKNNIVIHDALHSYHRIELAILGNNLEQEIDYYIAFDNQKALQECYEYFSKQRGNNLPFSRVKLHFYVWDKSSDLLPNRGSLTNELFTTSTFLAGGIGAATGIGVGGITVLVLAGVGILGGVIWAIPIVLGIGIAGLLIGAAIEILPRYKKNDQSITDEIVSQWEENYSLVENDDWLKPSNRDKNLELQGQEENMASRSVTSQNIENISQTVSGNIVPKNSRIGEPGVNRSYRPNASGGG